MGKNFEVTFDIFPVLVFQISVLESYLITKELIFGFQILDLKDHFSASLKIEVVLLSCYSQDTYLPNEYL